MPVVQRFKFTDPPGYRGSIALEERADGTHVFLGEPVRSKVRDGAAPYVADDAPMVSSIREATPADPKSGQQPAGVFTCDFRRDARSGRWLGQAGGKRFRLQQSMDGQTFRVSEDRAPPWAVRVGDKALASPERALSDEQHQAGLSRWQQLLDLAWKRKEPDAAA